MQAVLYGPTGLPLNPQTAVVVDPSSAAMRASLRAMEYQYPGSVGGHFRIGVPLIGGLTGVGASGILLGFRWAPTNPTGLLAVVKRISATAGTRTVAGSTAFALALDAVKVTGYSAQHSSGGTAILFTNAASQKMRSSMGNTQAAIYYANSTTVISGGTGVADAAAFGICYFDDQPVTTGVNRMGAPGDIYKDDSQAAHPLVLAVNEGFYVRLVSAQGTSAVTDVAVSIEWAEVLQY